MYLTTYFTTYLKTFVINGISINKVNWETLEIEQWKCTHGIFQIRWRTASQQVNLEIGSTGKSKKWRETFSFWKNSKQNETKHKRKCSFLIDRTNLHMIKVTAGTTNQIKLKSVWKFFCFLFGRKLTVCCRLEARARIEGCKLAIQADARDAQLWSNFDWSKRHKLTTLIIIYFLCFKWHDQIKASEIIKCIK
jgi:hypothetical protein